MKELLSAFQDCRVYSLCQMTDKSRIAVGCEDSKKFNLISVYNLVSRRVERTITSESANVTNVKSLKDGRIVFLYEEVIVLNPDGSQTMYRLNNDLSDLLFVESDSVGQIVWQIAMIAEKSSGSRFVNEVRVSKPLDRPKLMAKSVVPSSSYLDREVITTFDNCQSLALFAWDKAILYSYGPRGLVHHEYPMENSGVRGVADGGAHLSTIRGGGVLTQYSSHTMRPIQSKNIGREFAFCKMSEGGGLIATGTEYEQFEQYSEILLISAQNLRILDTFRPSLKVIDGVLLDAANHRVYCWGLGGVRVLQFS